MPVYVYRNLNTGETFEVEQRITEAALSVHPETGEPVKRLIQPVGIAFKGSGFYATDSRKNSSGKPESGAAKSEVKAEGPSESKSEKASDKSTEKKTENKSEAKSVG